MLRLLVRSLVLSSNLSPTALKRSTTAFATLQQNVHPASALSSSRAFGETCPRLNLFENQGAEIMAEAKNTEDPCVNAPKGGTQSKSEEGTKTEQLPKLSPQEFRIYNGMAEHMNYFHENFRQTWNLLYGACESGKRPAGMSIRSFLQRGADFCHHLTVHHGIEEQHIFPVLARKMPAFKKELELLTQHKQIHKGLDKFEKYIAECKSGERELRLEEMKGVMETFGEVLWTHLDDEVRELGAENMRRYWSVDEMRRMPM